MKRMQSTMTKFTAMLVSLILSIAALAQDKGTDINVNVNKGGGNWYTQPWVWIVGAAIFILLLVALLRGNNSSARD